MRRLLILAGAVVTAMAASASSNADNIPGSIRPIDVSACPGFAQVYPDQYVFSGNLDLGGVGPGEYVAPGIDTGGAITVDGNDHHLSYKIRGLTAPGEAPEFDSASPTLTDFAAYSYTLDGRFTGEPGLTGISTGTGQLRVTRSDGARMSGKATITHTADFGPQWTLAFTGDVHCS